MRKVTFETATFVVVLKQMRMVALFHVRF